MEQKYTEGKGILIQPYSFQIGLPIIKVISLDNGSAADPLLLRRSAYIAETLIFFFFFFFCISLNIIVNRGRCILNVRIS